MFTFSIVSLYTFLFSSYRGTVFSPKNIIFGLIFFLNCNFQYNLVIELIYPLHATYQLFLGLPLSMNSVFFMEPIQGDNVIIDIT